MASNDWKKMTVHDASGMKRHNGKDERMNGEHENKQIDKTKSHLNLYIGCDDYFEAYHNMRARVKEVDTAYPPKRKNKTDTRIICAMIEVPCPQEIYSQGYEQAQKFFYDVYQLYKNFFGAENVHGGFVHFDEIHEYTDKDGNKRMSLPHMHTLVSAYAEWTDRDKKTGATTPRKGINGKHFVTKPKMKELNTIVDDYCFENFGIHFLTGETPQRKSVEQLKAEDELHQLNGEKKQIQSELDKLKSQKEKVQQDIATLTEKKNETQHSVDESTAQLNETEHQIATNQSEIESLKKKIAELQQEILSITLPKKPIYPTKPIYSRPSQKNKEDYAKVMMRDYESTLNFIDRQKEKNRLYKEYDARVDEWNKYDEAVKEYDTILYPQWATSTETVKALQKQLREVQYQKQEIEKGERALSFGEEIRLKQKNKELEDQVKELAEQKEKLQSQLNLIRSQIHELAEEESKQERKRDAEIIAYYEQYCGISPDEIETAVMEQRKQDYDSD